jgi:hypothetical protein
LSFQITLSVALGNSYVSGSRRRRVMAAGRPSVPRPHGLAGARGFGEDETLGDLLWIIS